MSTRIELRDVSDQGGTRHLTARLNEQGNLVIEGQDVGQAVEDSFGDGIREYEWVWTVRRADVPRLLALVQPARDVLDGLKRRFSGDEAAGLHSFLSGSEVPFSSWSRHGD